LKQWLTGVKRSPNYKWRKTVKTSGLKERHTGGGVEKGTVTDEFIARSCEAGDVIDARAGQLQDATVECDKTR
jgi:hypothetical protein